MVNTHIVASCVVKFATHQKCGFDCVSVLPLVRSYRIDQMLEFTSRVSAQFASKFPASGTKLFHLKCVAVHDGLNQRLYSSVVRMDLSNDLADYRFIEIFKLTAQSISHHFPRDLFHQLVTPLGHQCSLQTCQTVKLGAAGQGAANVGLTATT